jgi:uncharacterized membrane protein
MADKERDSGNRPKLTTGRGIALGAGVGLIFGAAFGNPGVGMVLGAGAGLVCARIAGRGEGD